MERSTQKSGLVNLFALLVVSGAGFVVARHASCLSGQVASLFLGLGALVAFVSWFQMRLEESERLEKFELEEMARSKASTTLFESKEAEIFPARRAREQFERYFVPSFTVLLLLLQAGGAFFLWRWLSSLATIPPLNQEMMTLSLFGLFALVLFMLGRFSATIARLEDHRLLRPGASYLLLGAYLCFVTALAIAGVKAEFPNLDFYVARVLCAVLALNAIETFITLILEIYRPRVKGKVVRPLYESRLVGLLGQPEGLITTAAQALDYQFGFKVSETWFYRFFEKALGWLILLQLGALLLSTCFVVVQSGEQALLERFGRPVAGRAVLGPGLHLKWPWPVDKTYRYRTEQIQTFNIGHEPDQQDEGVYGKAILWTINHGKEDNFLVAKREESALGAESGSGERKAPPVTLLSINIPIQYQIRNLADWVYNHEDSSNLLREIATRETVRYLVSADINEIMSRSKLEAANTLRARIQAVVNRYKLGANILFVGLQGIHPPVKVAPDYENVIGAMHEKDAKIFAADADAVRTNALSGASAFALTNSAEAERVGLELTALARAAAFTNQIPAFNAAPSVYEQRAYAEAFTSATAGARKYVLLTTNTYDVIIYDLKQSLSEEYFNKVSAAVASPKTSQ
jgi:regulator of protease activity HflC (stomatin/prohibitin superfamily)